MGNEQLEFSKRLDYSIEHAKIFGNVTVNTYVRHGETLHDPPCSQHQSAWRRHTLELSFLLLDEIYRDE